jgi:hypothetical protein
MTSLLSSVLLAPLFALPAAPAPTKDVPLPDELLQRIQGERAHADDTIRRLKRELKDPRNSTIAPRLEEKIRNAERKFYDMVLRRLRNHRDYPDETTLKVTPEQRPALEKAITEYSRQLQRAIRNREASDKFQLEPMLPSEARNALRTYADQENARIREIREQMAGPLNAECLALLKEKVREQERWYYDRGIAHLREMLDNPDKALTGRKMTDEDKEAITTELKGFELGRERGIRNGRLSKTQQYPPPKKK